MECNYYKEQFSAFIDDELDEEEAKDFKAHILKCRGCAEQFRVFRKAQDLLLLLERKEAPCRLWDGIEGQIIREEEPVYTFFQMLGEPLEPLRQRGRAELMQTRFSYRRTGTFFVE